MTRNLYAMTTENTFADKMTKRLKQLLRILSQKSQHLIFELSNDPKGGFFWWIQTHGQQLALQRVLEEIRQESRKPNFQLNLVTQKLSNFKLKQDDAGQAQWYEDAHNQLINCQQQLDQASDLTLKMVQPALTELRFISEADQFHQYFQLETLQRRVREMYEAITERLDILLRANKNKNLDHQKQLDLRKQEADLQLAQEASRQKEILLETEQAELQKIENERALIDHQRDADEETWKREQAARKLTLEENHQQHQKDMQDSFGDLQLDGNADKRPHMKVSIGTDGLIDVSAQQHVDALLRKINNGEIDPSDPKIKSQLQALLTAIADL